MTTIYYSTKRGQPAIPAKVEAHVWPTERNPRAYLRIIGPGQPSTLLMGEPAQMVGTQCRWAASPWLREGGVLQGLAGRPQYHRGTSAEQDAVSDTPP